MIGGLQLKIVGREIGTGTEPLEVMAAFRYAPVAGGYAYNGSPSELGLKKIVCGAGHVEGKLFVHRFGAGGEPFRIVVQFGEV